MQEVLTEITQALHSGAYQKALTLVDSAWAANQSDVRSAQLLLFKAEALCGTESYDAAINAFHQAQHIAPYLVDSPASYELYANSLYGRFKSDGPGEHRRGDVSAAISAYQYIIEQFPHYEQIARVRYRYGELLLLADEPDKAAEAFQAVLKSTAPDDTLRSQCYERLAYIAFYNYQRERQALELINLAVSAATEAQGLSRRVSLHLFAARILLKLGQHSAVEPRLHKALKLATYNNDNKVLLGSTLLEAAAILAQIDGSHESVIAYLTEYFEVQPTTHDVDLSRSRAHQIIADAYMQTGAYLRAAKHYKSTLACNPHHPWETTLSYRIATCYYQAGEYDKVLQVLKEMETAAQADGSERMDYRVYDMRGNALFALERFAEAADAYDLALHLAPNKAPAVDKIKLYHHYAIQLSESENTR